MTRYYVTMTWHDAPEGGSYGTIVEPAEGEDPAALCRAEMAANQAEGDDDPECDEAYYLEEYGDEWQEIDCFDLDNFIARHSSETPYVILRNVAGILDKAIAEGKQMDGTPPTYSDARPPTGDDWNDLMGWVEMARKACGEIPEEVLKKAMPVTLWVERRGYMDDGPIDKPVLRYAVVKAQNTADYPPGHLYYSGDEINEIIANGITVNIK